MYSMRSRPSAARIESTPTPVEKEVHAMISARFGSTTAPSTTSCDIASERSRSWIRCHSTMRSLPKTSHCTMRSQTRSSETERLSRAHRPVRVPQIASSERSGRPPEYTPSCSPSATHISALFAAYTLRYGAARRAAMSVRRTGTRWLAAPTDSAHWPHAAEARAAHAGFTFMTMVVRCYGLGDSSATLPR